MSAPKNSIHNLQVALKCKQAGLSVFVAGPDKKPRVKWRDVSTTDPDQIKKWFKQWPDALPAIDLSKSRLIILDGDRHGGPDGVAAAEQLFAERSLNVVAIPTIITPQDGRHYWFMQPTEGEPLGNSDKPIHDKAINVRGAGGYVIAPGTRLPDGRQYKRDPSTPSALEAVQTGTVPVLPPAIVKLLRGNGGPSAEMPLHNGATYSPTSWREESYAGGALNSIAHKIASTPPNTGRNNELNNGAVTMGHMVAAGWIGRKTVEGRLFDAAITCGLVKDDGQRSVLATIKSGLDAGEKESHAPLPDREEYRGPNGSTQAKSGDGDEEKKNETHKDRQQKPQDVLAALVSAKASSYKMTTIKWLWRDRFAIGKLGIIAGLPDEGKGQLLAFIAAQATNGVGEWPMNEGRSPQGSVVIFSDEDDANDTLVPRLAAAGADLDRVHIITMVRDDKNGSRMFSLVSDLEALRRKIIEIGDVKLVLIDPISAYLGVGKVDSFRGTDVRAVLTPLTTLAVDTKVAVIGVMHFNKKTDVTNALLRVSDSLAFGAVARHVYGVIDDAENNRKLFVRAKNNVAAKIKNQTLGYRFGVRAVGTDEETGANIEAPYILWDPEYVDVTAVEAMQAAAETKSPAARDEARKFLCDLLAKGPALKTEIEDEATANGITQRTLFRAKGELQITAKKDGEGGRWRWHLPAPPSRRWSDR